MPMVAGAVKPRLCPDNVRVSGGRGWDEPICPSLSFNYPLPADCETSHDPRSLCSNYSRQPAGVSDGASGLTVLLTDTTIECQGA